MAELLPATSGRRMEAINGNASPERLRELADDEYEEVRAAVASNFNTPEDVLRELAKEKGPNVRYGVAGNGKTPTDLLEVLANDKNDGVCSTAQKQLAGRKSRK